MPTRDEVKIDLPQRVKANAEFPRRHIGPDEDEIRRMLKTVGAASLDALIESAVPSSIVSPQSIPGWPTRSEQDALIELRGMASQNWVWRSYLGTGYHDCITPSPILRNIL